MANEIRKIRAGIAQHDRNKATYGIMIWEIIIWSLVLGIAIGFIVNSTMAAFMAFITLLLFFAFAIKMPNLRFIVFTLFACGWGAPFWFIGAACGFSFFYFLSVFAFFFSYWVHYQGFQFVKDLIRSDDDV
jgi:hypothetical protein